MRHLGGLSIATILFLVGGSGCAERTRTVRATSETVVTPRVATAPSSATVVNEREVITRTAHDDEPQGVLSTTVHFIGEIIALPFRIVGALVRAIF